MMASRVIPPAAEEEGAEEDRAKKGGAAGVVGSIDAWLLRLKLSLTPPDRTNADGTHDGEERRERNENGKVLKDPCDS